MQRSTPVVVASDLRRSFKVVSPPLGLVIHRPVAQLVCSETKSVVPDYDATFVEVLHGIGREKSAEDSGLRTNLVEDMQQQQQQQRQKVEAAASNNRSQKPPPPRRHGY